MYYECMSGHVCLDAAHFALILIDVYYFSNLSEQLQNYALIKHSILHDTIYAWSEMSVIHHICSLIFFKGQY